MQLTRLRLENFRNHAHTDLVFAPGINVLVGANAQGKTNLLEAVYLACVGRGWRTVRDAEMIAFGCDQARVDVTAEKKFGTLDITLQLNRVGKKAIAVNQVPISKVAELMGQINCVFFSPDELKMVKEAPADRRRFLDIDLSQLDKSYFYALSRYRQILAERNAQLKNSPTARELAVWDDQLVATGTVLIAKRREFLTKLTPYLIKKHAELTGNQEKITVTYETVPDFPAALAAARDRDLRLRTTTVGPHRDDIAITINGQDVRTYASQGQQRTVALSIKLAELDLFTAVVGEAPILLLDDVFSELDAARQQRLLRAIQHVQVVITGTDTPTAGRIFTVRQGKVYAPAAKNPDHTPTTPLAPASPENPDQTDRPTPPEKNTSAVVTDQTDRADDTPADQSH